MARDKINIDPPEFPFAFYTRFVFNFVARVPNAVPMCANHNIEKPTRRNFFKEGLCIAIGTLISIVPFAAGLAVYFDPLRRKSAGPGGAIRKRGAFRQLANELRTIAQQLRNAEADHIC